METRLNINLAALIFVLALIATGVGGTLFFYIQYQKHQDARAEQDKEEKREAYRLWLAEKNAVAAQRKAQQEEAERQREASLRQEELRQETERIRIQAELEKERLKAQQTQAAREPGIRPAGVAEAMESRDLKRVEAMQGEVLAGLAEARAKAEAQQKKYSAAKRAADNARAEASRLNTELDNRNRKHLAAANLVAELNAAPAANDRHERQLAYQMEQAIRDRDAARAKVAEVETSARQAQAKAEALEQQAEVLKELLEPFQAQAVRLAADAEDLARTRTRLAGEAPKPPPPPPQDFRE